MGCCQPMHEHYLDKKIYSLEWFYVQFFIIKRNPKNCEWIESQCLKAFYLDDEMEMHKLFFRNNLCTHWVRWILSSKKIV